MKFIVDMNLPPNWVDYLMSGGHEALHWSSTGLGNDATDCEIIEAVRSWGCAVLTGDVGFTDTLLVTQANAPSIVLIRSRILLPEVIGKSVVAQIDRYAVELRHGAVLSIDETRGRVRLLPLD